MKGLNLSVTPDEFAQAHVDMFEARLFGQRAAFWRWASTEIAAPCIAVFAADRRAPRTDEDFTLATNSGNLLDPGPRPKLAKKIEATHG